MGMGCRALCGMIHAYMSIISTNHRRHHAITPRCACCLTQILTHVREKLQFVEKENGALQSQLEELDLELSEKRDRLGKAKATRDTLRQQGRKIKQSSVYITNPNLLDDIEVGCGGGSSLGSPCKSCRGVKCLQCKCCLKRQLNELVPWHLPWWYHNRAKRRRRRR